VDAIVRFYQGRVYLRCSKAYAWTFSSGGANLGLATHYQGRDHSGSNPVEQQPVFRPLPYACSRLPPTTTAWATSFR
jgi:hypothetical protein